MMQSINIRKSLDLGLVRKSRRDSEGFQAVAGILTRLVKLELSSAANLFSECTEF